MFFESPVTRTLIDGQTTVKIYYFYFYFFNFDVLALVDIQAGVSLTGTSDGYLAPGANLTISITALTLIGSSGMFGSICCGSIYYIHCFT